MPETDAASTNFASTSLARAAEVPIPQAGALAGRLPLTANPSPLAEGERAAVLRSLHFGNAFINHMAHARWGQDEGWGDCGVIPYGSLGLSPAVAVLHYGQEVFEGIKAYRRENGSVWTFHPRYNTARLSASARRMTLPELTEENFVTSLMDLAHASATWVPSGEGESLYLRLFAFVSEAFLGMRLAAVVDYYVVAPPAGSYSPHSLEPVSIWVTIEYRHTGRGGTGAARTGSNYTSSLLPQQEAYVRGCDQVCFPNNVSQKNIEKLGDMNLMVVDADGTVHTPRLIRTILKDYTHSAIIRLLRDSGRNVVEKIISLRGLLADIESGRISEVLACGTATAVVSLGHLRDEGFDAHTEDSGVTWQIHDQLITIQTGRAEDLYGWVYQLVPLHS